MTWAGDSDYDNIEVEAEFEGNIATTNSNKYKNFTATTGDELKANQAISRGGHGSTDYHLRPQLLYNQLVHRYTQLLQILIFNFLLLPCLRLWKNASGIEEDFYGEVVSGSYIPKTKKWSIYYKEAYVTEDINVHELLRSLHNYE